MAVSIERVLGPDFLDHLGELGVAELRERRGDCQEIEGSLSFFRRLVQGRLDIVHAELSRRAGGEAPTDLAALVDRLPSILADSTRAPARGVLPDVVAPDDAAAIAADLNQILDPERLATLPDLSEADIHEIADRLTELERETSARRRTLHEIIDTLQAQIVQRYKTGEATVDALLQ